MLINQETAVSTSSILLVPYTRAHVPAYHEWMKDTEIQKFTASEPLSLSEEYDMQKSWRTDADKLTFIVCLPLPVESSNLDDERPRILRAGDETMVGDVNLFLSLPDGDEEDHQVCVGELELMIAKTDQRRRGHGRAAVLSFMQYIEVHLDEILDEFGTDHSKWKGIKLRVKISGENEKSIGLFQSIGFERVGEGVNYFGEVEMRLDGVLRSGDENLKRLAEGWEVSGYRELVYDEI